MRQSSMRPVICLGRFQEMSSKIMGCSLGIAGLLAIACLIAFASPASLQADSDPWTKAQTVQPADLEKELGNSKSAPTVVFVGFKNLRVLLLPQDFATDWAGKGLPYDTGN